MPSKKAARYGSRCEKYVIEEYGLVGEGVHTSWKDAEHKNGVAVEIKACNLDTGYFQIYRQYHDRLRQEGGYYAFAVYKPHGSGVRVLKTKMVDSESLTFSHGWSPTNHDTRKSEKARVPIGDIF
jgi:hypothetical protein